MKILIADDHTIFCEGLRRVLDTQRELSVVGVAKNGLEAIKLAGRYLPEVILMDVEMPKMGGIEATCAIRKSFPQIKVLMLTMHAENKFVFESRRVGAYGYISKNADMEELLEAIKSLFDPGDGDMGEKMYSIFDKKDEDNIPELTEREKELVKLLAAGLSNKEISTQLSISKHTVKNHLTNIYNKLNCTNRAGLLCFFHGESENERRRLASVLHDDVMQSIASLMMRVNLLKRKDINERVEDELTEITDILKNILQSCWFVNFQTDSLWVEKTGFLPAFEVFINNFKHKNDIAVELDCNEFAPKLNKDVEIKT